MFDPMFDILPPRMLPDEPGFVRVTSLNGKQVLRLPVVMNGELAYLVGVIIGDGYVSKPARRKSHGTGYYWRVVITGPYRYLVNLRRLFSRVFGVRGGLVKDKRKAKSWQLRFANSILHRFLTRVIGIGQGRKSVNGSWSEFDLVKEFPLHFLAGLIHSDGYIGSRYVGIIQRRRQLLVDVRRFAYETLGLKFHGPIVNRRLNGEIVGWIISIYRKKERAKLVRDLAGLGVGAEKCDKWLKRENRGFDVGP